ncbi:tetratricopeptide repeat protein [Rhodohalobacter sp. 8-1]|uniref:tetratricopeptide repeat protein n=1 Tax=Rhodohalobacter sp. 8-1 TaxID=3131972 RepID=UPI0030ED3B13
MLLVIILSFALGSCNMAIPKYTQIQSEYPPNYYLGDSPNVSVVEAEGATRRIQDITIQELTNQSRSKGYFTIENKINEGIRFDTQQGKVVMTDENMDVNTDDAYIKINIIASMRQDGRTTITRRTGILGTEEETVPAMMTILPIAFTVTKGEDVLLNERQYDGKVVWSIDDYPVDYRERLEVATGKAVEEFIADITPRSISRRARLDYSNEELKPILDAARDGQVREAATQIEEYVAKNSNSASAVYNLAVLTDALGDYEKALNYYDEALSLGGKDYYTESKTNCMKRLSEYQEMAE